MNTYHFGVLWDSYTPAVEGQLIRDIFALQAEIKDKLVAIVPSAAAAKLLNSLNVDCTLGPTHLATCWILYQTTATPPEEPGHAETVIRRNLYLEPSKGVLDTNPHSGYALPEQGRIGNTSTVRNKPAPTSVGFVDPYIVQRWG